MPAPNRYFGQSFSWISGNVGAASTVTKRSTRLGERFVVAVWPARDEATVGREFEATRQ
jgi:hypothetical protein